MTNSFLFWIHRLWKPHYLMCSINPETLVLLMTPVLLSLITRTYTFKVFGGFSNIKPVRLVYFACKLYFYQSLMNPSIEYPLATVQDSVNSLSWSHLSHVWLFVTPWTVAHQAPPSMEFSRQEFVFKSDTISLDQ